MKRKVDVRPEYYPEYVFCIVPIPDETPAAYMSTVKGTPIICEQCNKRNFQNVKEAYIDKAMLWDEDEQN